MTILKRSTTTPRKRALTFEWGDRDYHLPFGARDKPYPPLTPIVRGAYRAARHDKVNGPASSPAIASVEVKRGGWYRGVASLGRRDVFTGPWVRDRDEALAWARDGVAAVREA